MVAAATDKKPIHLSGLYARGRLRAIAIRHVRGRFDSAATTADNRRHWANADALSADSAASADVRRTLRNRARYEVANNSYARGIVLTLANDTVGTGPRLQLLTDQSALNQEVEHAFEQWAAEVSLAEKLRTMRMARAQDGEAFGVLVNNPILDHPVKLDLRLVEADHVTSPTQYLLDDQEADGIRLDAFGNPSAYHVLREHPGGSRFAFTDDFMTVPAPHMVHVFRQDRPGQHRGIPEITPALPLFAQLRRYTLAVLAAAEAAADFAGILYTDAPANGEAESVKPMDSIELERNMLLTMPGGWKMSQVEPMQPTTTYAEFKKEILNEIARCLNMPYNVAAGNSSGYNYASGRLDHQTYFKAIRVDQAFMALKVLDRILAAWLWEYALTPLATFDLPLMEGRVLPTHQWFWDGTEHVDPAKEANAQETRLKNHTTTLAHEYARQGRDWEEELRQRAREKALMRELGLTEAQAAPSSRENDALSE
ncbi:MAG TPA: phage portal protein [Phycisphaerae bacterium]|nr:phage portal protein [Phycisphaerae bacterium]